MWVCWELGDENMRRFLSNEPQSAAEVGGTEEIKGVKQLFWRTERQTHYASVVGLLGDAEGPLAVY